MTHIVSFLKISRSQWLWMIGGIILGVAVIIANTLLMAVSGWFIASMAIAGGSGVPFNYFVPSATIRFLAITRTVGRYLERLITHEATLRILSDLRVWLFNRFIPLAPASLERYSGGDLTGRLRSDVDALETLYLRIVAPVAVGGISITVGLLFIAYFSLSVAVAMLLFLLFAAVCLPLLVNSFSKEPGKNSTTLTAKLRNKVTDGIQGVEELVILGAMERQAASVDLLSSQLIDEQERLGRINGFSLSGMALLSGTAVAIVLLITSGLVASHQITPPNLVMLLLFSAAIFEAAAQIPSALNLLPAAQESANRIFKLAYSKIPVPDNPNPSTKLPTDYSICFKNVYASYLPEKPIIQNISFTVPTGGRLILNGTSGIGKTLLIEILLRFRDYKGSVTVGGVEINTLLKESLVGMMTVVPQRPYLFNGTILENILLGNSAADRETIDAALRDSCLDSWVGSLPLGLATEVGSNGSLVSGGEARRIALARALLKKVPILLLDEPTEGLDSETEREVVSRLNERFRKTPGTTVLVVSHRPACLLLGDSKLHLF